MMKMKKALFLIFILFASCFQFAYGATDEGYGEDQTSLGQFVDSFENTDNVTVMDDVINNVTLECMELEYTAGVPIPENYNDFTEVDIPANRIVIQNNTWVEHHAERDEETYLYRDYGVDYFDDFTHDFDFESAYDQVGGLGNPYVLTKNWVNDVFGSFQAVGERSVDVRLYRHGTIGNQFILYYFNGGGGVGDSDTWNGPTSNVVYYVRVLKNGAGLWMGVYSTDALRDAGDGTDGDEANLFVNLGSDLKFRYLYAVATWNDGQNFFMNYDVYNLYIGSVAVGFADDGYFMTDDYMNDTSCNGTSLVLMTNTTIPSFTEILVHFSEDNATWILNDWEPMFGGFESIDLRVLNYTDIYFMFNLSTTDSSVTPRVYQARLISTIGNNTGGAVAGPSGAIGLIMLILICSPLIVLLVWGIRKR